MADEEYLKKVKKIYKQFLCCCPLLNFDWQNIFDSLLTEHNQEYLINKTVNSEIVLKYPIQINYQKLFLKQIISKLEKQIQSIQESVIYDEVYSVYGRLVAAVTDSQENYKHYVIGDKETEIITLKESNNLISDGTTGLRTWQAALALSEWLFQNKDSFKNKTVLELGSGIGLTGLVLEKVCKPKCIYLTDYHAAVLKNLCENVNINLITTPERGENSNDFIKLKDRCVYTNNNCSNLSIFNLPWEDYNADICKELGVIDIVVAADIVYDNELFKPLLNALNNLKQICNVQKFIFSCTERNAETLQEFLKLMHQIFGCIEQITTPEQSIFIWSNDTPVKIYRFKD